MLDSHLVTVPSTHSRCKILLATSKSHLHRLLHPYSVPSSDSSVAYFCIFFWYCVISPLKPQGKCYKSKIHQSKPVGCQFFMLISKRFSFPLFFFYSNKKNYSWILQCDHISRDSVITEWPVSLSSLLKLLISSLTLKLQPTFSKTILVFCLP